MTLFQKRIVLWEIRELGFEMAGDDSVYVLDCLLLQEQCVPNENGDHFALRENGRTTDVGYLPRDQIIYPNIQIDDMMRL